MSIIVDELAIVESSECVAEGHRRIRFRSPRIARRAAPGQFVNIRCGGQTLLRRPFSFSRVVGGSFEVLVRVIGEGTRRLAERKPGDQVWALGPLGHGFEIVRGTRCAVMVGGGCGIGPMEILGEALRRKRIETIALFGCQNRRTLPISPADFERRGIATQVAVMEGRGGHRGPVTDLLEECLASGENPDGAVLYACGPWGMLKKTAEIAARRGARCQVLLEEMMGCGLGACMSCACETVLPGGGVANKKVCTDGPMFWADQVNWNARK